MTTQANTTKYKRQATAMGRLYTRSPSSIGTMVTRIRGVLTEDALTDEGGNASKEAEGTT